MTDTNIQLLDPENLPTTVIEAFGGDEHKAVSLHNHINKGTLGCNAEWLIFQLRNPLHQAVKADANGDFNWPERLYSFLNTNNDCLVEFFGEPTEGGHFELHTAEKMVTLLPMVKGMTADVVRDNVLDHEEEIVFVIYVDETDQVSTT